MYISISINQTFADKIMYQVRVSKIVLKIHSLELIFNSYIKLTLLKSISTICQEKQLSLVIIKVYKKKKFSLISSK